MNNYKKHKLKFKLNEENIKTCIKIVLNNIKIPKDMIVGLNIMKSPIPDSNSYYVRCSIDTCYMLLRISDHETKLTEDGGSNNYINIIAGKTTKQYTVCQAIEDLIIATQRKRSNYLMFKQFESIY